LARSRKLRTYFFFELLDLLPPAFDELDLFPALFDDELFEDDDPLALPDLLGEFSDDFLGSPSSSRSSAPAASS
jgi:hypothetical protein